MAENIILTLQKNYSGAVTVNTYHTNGNYEVTIMDIYGSYHIKAAPIDTSACLFAPQIDFFSKDSGALIYPATPVPYELMNQSIEYTIHAGQLFQYLYEHYEELIQSVQKENEHEM